MRAPPLAAVLVIICIPLAAVCIGHHSAWAHIIGVALAAILTLEGLALALNWRGSTEAARMSAGRSFRFSPLGGISGWELRMIGGFYVLVGLILVGAVIAH